MKKIWYYLYLCIAMSIIFLNILAWNSTAFCDFYLDNIFPVFVNTYGRFWGIFSISVGEIMLLLAVILVTVFFLLLLYILFFMRKQKTLKWPKMMGGRMIKSYYLFFAWTFLMVSLIMTLNCFILYHSSTLFSTNGIKVEQEYTLEELIQLRNMIVNQCNLLALEMDRDQEGYLIYSNDMEQIGIEAMQNLGQKLTRLEGYYPRPKKLAASDFFSQQYIQGYYFPFSLEANYNDVMYIANVPSTICHELAHLRGYIFEDEANFISYLACTSSEDTFFQYCGYLSVLNYVDNDFYKAVNRDNTVYSQEIEISSLVKQDNIFLREEEWERIEEKALIDTEKVDKVSDAITEATLKINGVSDGMLSYNRVVELLLSYYKK